MKYYIYEIRTYFRNFIGFFKNIWLFRKELWNFKSWDYTFNLEIFKRTLKLTKNNIIQYSTEIFNSKMKKVKQIERVIELLDYEIKDNYIELAEKELNMNVDLNNNLKQTKEQKEHNKIIFEKASEISNNYWNELWDIIKGTDDSDKIENYEDFNGSDMRGWWD